MFVSDNQTTLYFMVDTQSLYCCWQCIRYMVSAAIGWQYKRIDLVDICTDC